MTKCPKSGCFLTNLPKSGSHIWDQTLKKSLNQRVFEQITLDLTITSLEVRVTHDDVKNSYYFNNEQKNYGFLFLWYNFSLVFDVVKNYCLLGLQEEYDI